MSDNTFIFRSARGGLFPTCPLGTEYMNDLGGNRDVTAKLWTMRNMARHRRFWAMMNEAAQNIDEMQSAENLVTALKIKSGMYQMFARSDGILVAVPRSLAVNSMDEVSFKRVETRFLEILAKHYGFVPEELVQETERILATYGR